MEGNNGPGSDYIWESVITRTVRGEDVYKRQVYATIRTGSDGRATITRPKAGTYTIRETKAPDGYLLSDKILTFTVTGSGEIAGDVSCLLYTSRCV